jgi:hypothetical protein
MGTPAKFAKALRDNILDRIAGTLSFSLILYSSTVVWLKDRGLTAFLNTEGEK